jgi:transposase
MLLFECVLLLQQVLRGCLEAMRSLSRDKENNVVALSEKGCSSREMSNVLGLSQSTVNRVRKKRGVLVELSKGGRPHVLSPSDKQFVTHLVTHGRLQTATDATRELEKEVGKHVCEETVRNALRDSGLHSFAKISKPFLSKKNVAERREFASLHKNWTVNDWEKVIFSDETRINRFNSDGKSWCWVSDCGRLSKRAVKQTVKHGGGSVMFWGCLTTKGVGLYCQVDQRMNATRYVEVLKADLYGTLEKFEFDPKSVIFQQDNAPAHTAKIVQNWFAEQPFDVLKWPAQSPDLNPIEHLWASVKRKLNSYSTPPCGLIQLSERVRECLDSISIKECKNLYASMPDRVAAVLAANGLWTKY